MFSIVLNNLPLRWFNFPSDIELLNGSTFSQELWGSQPRKAEDRDKEQELKWKLAEAIICCVCSPHVGSSLRSIKSQSGGSEEEGLLSWSTIQPTAEYGWRRCQVGVGSCCFGKGLGEGLKATQPVRWQRMVCTGCMDSAAAQECAAEWAQPTQVHVCLPARRCWHEISL